MLKRVLIKHLGTICVGAFLHTTRIDGQVQLLHLL